MTQPDFISAKAYALQRLAHELHPYLTYHSLKHTRDDVVVSVQQLIQWHEVAGEDALLLQTASYFHDIGFVQQRDNHEQAGIELIYRVLPHFGYNDAQIATIAGIIMATKMPQNPNTLLEAIMADADMNSLGRPDFFVMGDLLRKELALFGATMTDVAWYEFEIRFLSNHAYFTEGAQALYSAQKAHNLVVLQQHLEQARQNANHR